MSLATRQPAVLAEYEELDDSSRETEIVNPSSLGAIVRSEIEAQVATARRYPRSIKRFLDKALSQVNAHKSIAEKCIYALERWDAKEQKKKIINGPSVRMAEILASCYGNLRCQTRIASIDDRFIKVEASCLDTENNVGISQEVQRRITTAAGKTFNEDMIAVTANAAMSIALRNAIFRVIPVAYRDIIYHEAKQVASGRAASFAETRDDLVSQIAGMGVPLDRLLSAIEAKSIDDMDAEHVATMQGILNKIEDGATVAEMFPLPLAPADPSKSKSANIAAKLKGQPEPGSQG